MKAHFLITRPDEIECAMTITMTLAQWKAVRDGLSTDGDYAKFQLRAAITDLVGKAEKQFQSTSQEEA